MDFPDVELASATMVDAGQAMASDLTRLSGAVEDLLGSGWRGTAASAFATEWDAWHSAAGRVVAALARLGRTLGGGGSAYIETEAAVRRAAS